MFVCHCLAVTDRTIAESIESGARDLRGIGEQCGAGTGCGGCHLALRKMLADHRREQARRRRRRPGFAA